MMAVIVATIAVGVLTALAGWLLTRRSGNVREIRSAPGQGAGADTADLGLSRTGPTIVHFSAPWCGPCDRVRRVVDQVCEDLRDLGDIAHVEIDLDANPAAARRFSVLSLPTTLIFDADGQQRYRTSGVPKAADLQSALEPLLA
ncbi:thioredoxin family protein [Mycobacterium haemophilum]|uniref:Thioredoxin n=1 Tax=Mycobacterium haemophilum TaxID=29311 RepID=A0A0I9YEW3_9MYCO|nr:thioredoxin family protein [Mycobacterium haemophilum]AKN16135.1 thioredoxin [Mycobacterium haemophilum DSM 44634]KLO29885.1 thioredoxin [Mycobacterium haemophilum]KLO38467.1 thioredoxin [Mycobacterium haemophilum]KLO44801.1 thioredoxin [Mycobacterium haemophilum]KLO56144.1 thioredoxin [Mycobacterium haemophilum]